MKNYLRNSCGFLVVEWEPSQLLWRQTSPRLPTKGSVPVCSLLECASALSTSCLFKHLCYHSANPRFTETARAHPQQDRTAKRDETRAPTDSLCQTLHFLCKCPEGKKKEHFQWVKLLSWDLCSGRRSVKDKMRCFKLFTVCSLPSLRSPSKLFFFCLLLLPFFFHHRDPANSLLILSWFHMWLWLWSGRTSQCCQTLLQAGCRL